jgi:hypothetical protein
MAFLTEAANRGSIGGYDIDNSCKFEQDNSESMTRTATQSQGGNRKTWTWSGWIKRTELGRHMYLFSAGGTGFEILSNDNLRFSLYYNNTSYYLDLNAKLRDTSAWYHIVGQLDTTQSTAQDRVKVWINGERQTSFSNDSAHNIPQNADVQHLNEATGTSTGWMKICDWYASGRFFSGYTADWYFTDGVANEPTEFGEYDSNSGIWIPKEYDGSYGTNGFYLDFADASDLGDDESGNGNDFSEGNLTSADQSTDTPTNNFSTGNLLGPFRVGHWNFTEGATYAQYAGGNDWGSFTNTMAVGSGKWYVEIQAGGSDLFVGAGSEDYNFVGAGNGAGFPEIYYGYTGTNSVGYHANNGDVYNNGTQTVIGTTYTTNDIISVALDMDNGKIYFAKNGTYINSQNPVTGANSIALPDTSARYFIGGSSYGTGKNHRCNYGGYTTMSISSAASDENGYGTFEYAPPSGYYALCTKNLAEYG